MAEEDIDFSTLAKRFSEINYAGNEVTSGAPEDLVLNGSFEDAFRSHGLTFDTSTGRFKVNTKLEFAVNLTGPKPASFWTSRAIERVGGYVDNGSEQDVKIHIDQERLVWTISFAGEHIEVNSIEALLKTVAAKKNLQLNKDLVNQS